MSSRRELANAIRALSMDAVQKANSGHPGAPMGMADIAEVLWNDHMKHNPANPKWADRDRFVLSNGHGSMLIYSLLHLTGYDLTIDDLKNFRQLHSKTPGHPEYGYAPGVETTTGPLGQGITNAVGMAIAERALAAEFNRPGHDIVDHHTYVFLGDGCLMEGISHEACSLAGTLGLGKLICFWDDNGISIDGHVEGWFSDDTPKRFEAYGWHVIADVDGHDPASIQQHYAFLFAGIGPGDDGANRLVGWIVGLMGHARRDVAEIPRFDLHDMFEIGSVPHLGMAFEHENRRLVGFVIMGSGRGPGWDGDNVHAELLGPGRFGGDAGEIRQPLFAVIGLTTSDELAGLHGRPPCVVPIMKRNGLPRQVRQ